MTGRDYEFLCAEYIKQIGFYDIEVTKGSGDQGVDIIAYKDGLKYAFQCKYYNNPIGNKAVQEIYTGSRYYFCDKKVVISNNEFTKSAKELANRTDVELWSGITQDIIQNAIVNGTEVKDLKVTYGEYYHILPLFNTYIIKKVDGELIDNNDVEKEYKKSVLKIEELYNYLKKYDVVHKYKPTGSYNNSIFNCLLGINNKMNYSLEEIIRTIGLALSYDGITAFEGTNLHREGDRFTFSIQGSFGNNFLLKKAENHFNKIGLSCTYSIKAVNYGEIEFTISKINHKSNTLFENVKNDKIESVKDRMIEYKDGYKSKKFFQQFEDGIFEYVGYELLNNQKIIVPELLIDKIQLLSAELNLSNGLICFYYYSEINNKAFKFLKYKRLLGKDKSCNNDVVFFITSSIRIDDFCLKGGQITFIKAPMISFSFENKNSIFNNHMPENKRGMIKYINNYYFVVT